MIIGNEVLPRLNQNRLDKLMTSVRNSQMTSAFFAFEIRLEYAYGGIYEKRSLCRIRRRAWDNTAIYHPRAYSSFRFGVSSASYHAHQYKRQLFIRIFDGSIR